jgi:sodium transport system permease protein
LSARPGSRSFRVVLAYELLLLLRDRRALLLAVILPTALYPLVFLGQRGLENASRKAIEERRVVVACDLEGLEAKERLLDLLRAEESVDVEIVDARALRSIDSSAAVTPAEADLVRSLAGGPESVVLVARNLPDESGVALRLSYDGANEVAVQAKKRVDHALDLFQKEGRAARAIARIGADPGRGLETSAVDVASPSDAAGSTLGRFLPLLAVIVVLSGGSYAALSVFAGEREAGTLETLLVQPARAEALVAAKFGAVLLTGLLTLLLNGASILLCLQRGLGSLPGVSAEAMRGVGPGAERLVLGVVVFFPAAVLLCALLCLACGRARTFREGQYTLLPLLLVCLVPAALASQDVDLDRLLAAVPLAGPSLALRDALRGNLSTPLALWMFVASSAWAGVALVEVARSLRTERLVQSESSEEETAMRSVQSRYALRWAWVAVFLVYVVGGPLQAWNLPGGLFLTLWVLLPALALLSARGTARRAGERLATALHLVRPKLAHCVGALCLAPAVAGLARMVYEWQRTVLPLPSRIEQGDLLQSLENVPLGARLFLLAISPAICEELFFRGALLSGLRRDLSAASCLAWEAVLFGAAHNSIYRLVPTGLLGVLLTAIVLRGRSLVPAMLLHAAYNSIVLFDVDVPGLTWLAIPGVFLLLWRGPAAAAKGASRA